MSYRVASLLKKLYLISDIHAIQKVPLSLNHFKSEIFSVYYYYYDHKFSCSILIRQKILMLSLILKLIMRIKSKFRLLILICSYRRSIIFFTKLKFFSSNIHRISVLFTLIQVFFTAKFKIIFRHFVI